jgi:hypothetical protein
VAFAWCGMAVPFAAVVTLRRRIVGAMPRSGFRDEDFLAFPQGRAFGPRRANDKFAGM